MLPLAVYNVSGEYSMLKMAGKMGLIDYEKVLIETMIGFKRAGADIIISYHAKEVVKILPSKLTRNTPKGISGILLYPDFSQ